VGFGLFEADGAIAPTSRRSPGYGADGVFIRRPTARAGARRSPPRIHNQAPMENAPTPTPGWDIAEIEGG
jgi:hypothetical protein